MSSESGVSAKASAFKKLEAKTGWRQAWLVVSSAEKGQPGRPSKTATSGRLEKVSLAEFAKLAGVGRSTVQYYYNAWDLAYHDGTTPCPADKVRPTEDVEPPDEFLLDDDDLAKPWAYYFDWAKTGSAPKIAKYFNNDDDDDDEEVEDKTPKQKTPSKPAPEAHTPIVPDKKMNAEFDASSRFQQLIDVREALEANTEKVTKIGRVKSAEDVAAVQDAIARAEKIIAQLRSILPVSVGGDLRK